MAFIGFILLVVILVVAIYLATSKDKKKVRNALYSLQGIWLLIKEAFVFLWKSVQHALGKKKKAKRASKSKWTIHNRDNRSESVTEEQGNTNGDANSDTDADIEVNQDEQNEQGDANIS